VATGIGGSGAERLTGRGDFLAVSAAGVTRFQAAFVSGEEILTIVNRLRSGERGWDMDAEPERPIPIERVFGPRWPAPIGRLFHRPQAG
jgi:DNA segregation ATPase FtsK/SpoIIIE-like protein